MNDRSNKTHAPEHHRRSGRTDQRCFAIDLFRLSARGYFQLGSPTLNHRSHSWAMVRLSTCSPCSSTHEDRNN